MSHCFLVDSDILGWFAPTVIKAKYLIQLLWKARISWDEPFPTELVKVWKRWNSELPAITKHAISRKLVKDQETVQQIQLHGFSDASQIAYGAAVYARYLHKDSTVTIVLLIAKTRVAPTKSLSISLLELCGAVLLPKLISTTAEELQLPSGSQTSVWIYKKNIL